MANLTIQNIDERIVNALEDQAKRHGTSAEHEHKRILELALIKPNAKTFAQVISNMPNVGQDSDFERIDDVRDYDVFN